MLKVSGHGIVVWVYIRHSLFSLSVHPGWILRQQIDDTRWCVVSPERRRRKRNRRDEVRLMHHGTKYDTLA